MVIVSTFYPRNKFPSTTDAEALWTVELAWHQIFFNEGSAFSCIESISFRWEIMSDCFRNGRTYLFPFRNLINLGHAWASAEFFKESYSPDSGWPSAGDKQYLDSDTAWLLSHRVADIRNCPGATVTCLLGIGSNGCWVMDSVPMFKYNGLSSLIRYRYAHIAVRASGCSRLSPLCQANPRVFTWAW